MKAIVCICSILFAAGIMMVAAVPAAKPRAQDAIAATDPETNITIIIIDGNSAPPEAASAEVIGDTAPPPPPPPPPAVTSDKCPDASADDSECQEKCILDAQDNGEDVHVIGKCSGEGEECSCTVVFSKYEKVD